MDLPTELIELVLKFLQHDLLTLKLCSLVAKTWLPLARRHIFRAIHLHRMNTPAFLGLICHPLTSITNIQILQLTGPFSEHVHPDANESETPSGDVPYLIDICKKIHIISHTISFIRLDELHLSKSVTTLSSLLSQSFISVAEVHFISIDFYSLGNLFKLISAFSNLKKLRIRDSDWSVNPSVQGSASEFTIPLSLQSLSLGLCCKRDVLNWFLSHDIPPVISILSLADISSKDTASIGQYLGYLGNRLEKLSIGFSSLDAGGDAEDFCSATDISLNTQLRSLSIDKFVFFSEYTFSTIFPWILDILRGLKSEKMKEICFHLYLSSTRELYRTDDPVPWDDFDHILSEPPLTAIPYIFFLIHGRHVDLRGVREGLFSLFPKCTAQRRIHILGNW